MWSATLTNGQTATELTHKWSDIKGDILALSYDYRGVVINLPPAKGFIQYKSASASLLGGNVDIESQTIGFILENGTKILLRFHFKENKIETIIE